MTKPLPPLNTTVTDQELADYIKYWKLDDLANPQHRHGLHMGQRMALALRAARQEAAEVEKLNLKIVKLEQEVLRLNGAALAH
jgi:hypothetical protein